MTKPGFHHGALIYEGADEFLAGTMPLLRESIEAGQPALVAVRASNAELLRGELGDDAAGVEYVDMEAVGRNPARIIPVWREFLDGALEDGPVLGIGEPAWPGRSEAELDECRRHEALLNVAFGGGPQWSLLCPYDASALGEDVLAGACGNHPGVVRSGTRTENEAWEGSEASYSPFGGELPDPLAGSEAFAFSRSGLAGTRELVHGEAGRAGLSARRTRDVVTAVSELAANSVRHGGGNGTLLLWREPGALVVEVRDGGRVESPLAGRQRPTLGQNGGRGLWMANQLCDLVQIRSGEGGTAVRLRMDLARTG